MERQIVKKYHTNISGFTLAETVIVVSIYTLILGALAVSISAVYKLNAYSFAQANQVYTASHGMDTLVRDLREMTFADDGTFPLAVMQPNKIGFYSDIDHDNSVEYVEYELSSTTLEKKIFNAVGSPPVYKATPDETDILSEYVQNLVEGTSTFSYFDANGNLSSPTTTVTDIVYIGAKIIVNIDPVRDPGEFVLRGSAALRNLNESD